MPGPDASGYTPVVFSARGAGELAGPAPMRSLATAEQLWVHLKVYEAGGENQLHRHPVEDHAFIVLAGEATFRLGDGRSVAVGAHEGILLPRGTAYRFTSGAETLVVLRVGAGTRADAPEGDDELPGPLRVRHLAE